MEDFELFKKTFRKYQEKFGLLGYAVYLKFEPITGGDFADITVNQNDMVATIRLNSKLDEKDEQFKHIELSAKHEAMHLLLSRFENKAINRCNVSEKEIFEIEEELVNKLCGLIP